MSSTYYSKCMNEHLSLHKTLLPYNFGIPADKIWQIINHTVTIVVFEIVVIRKIFNVCFSLLFEGVSLLDKEKILTEY